jgi:hypothetical protein
MTTPGWDGILDEGEDIIWQGRPDAKLVFKPENIVMFLFGLAFAGFALFWMVMASMAGGFFWMFGLIHFSVGVGIAGGALFWNAYKRKHSWYTLTSRRAFIATDMPVMGRSLKSYPIDEDTVLDFIDGDLATIHFATERKRGKNGTYTVNIGFEWIENGRAVYQIFRDIQRSAA